jgi:hypothetical protein
LPPNGQRTCFGARFWAGSKFLYPLGPCFCDSSPPWRKYLSKSRSFPVGKASRAWPGLHGCHCRQRYKPSSIPVDRQAPLFQRGLHYRFFQHKEPCLENTPTASTNMSLSTNEKSLEKAQVIVHDEHFDGRRGSQVGEIAILSSIEDTDTSKAVWLISACVSLGGFLFGKTCHGTCPSISAD